MTLYLLRHGETLWNTQSRFQGQLDSPLTPTGIAQADLAARRLAEEIPNPDCFELHISPLGRARQTAARVAAFIPLPAKEEARLIEVTIGSWDGMTLYEIDQEHPGALDGTDAFDWYFRSPDGETFEQICARAKSWLADTVSTPTIAISHGLTGRIIRGVYLGLSRREVLTLPVPQNGFYRLEAGRADFIE
ncbi:histidine phosphatase family protein [Devosia neptuniae]|uniref:Histidine phosphatase family protein n=1 Tax=Devosia neptuniae TaxID=191302 RepID=A0ABY6CDU1_9HYPH|nr:histidine phosphatase family protein [Devosia neptuniae]UXN68248.1 histidine phosphatase family protein [Devosia neptuniae]